MPTQKPFSTRLSAIHQYRSWLPSLPILSAITIIMVGGGVLLALPDGRTEPATTASAETTASSGSQAAPDVSLCEKQAWPYIDQRCAERVEKARGTRQVRIVTDKGNSVTVMTAQPTVEAKPKSASPIVEAKPKPAPQVTTAANTDRQIGPQVVAPTAPGHVPQTEKVAAPSQPSPLPAPAEKVAVVAPQSQPTLVPQTPAPQAAPVPAPPVQVAAAPASESAPAPAQPQNASLLPTAQGVDAFDEYRPRKSRNEQRRELREERREAREERREARREARRQMIEQSRADEVAINGRGMREQARRGRNAVPDEVIAAVEQATAREVGRSRQVVTMGSSGERIYLVPRNGW